MTPSNITSIVAQALDTIAPRETPAAAEPRYGAAFHRLRGAIVAVSSSAFVPISVDVIAAMATVLGTLPKLRAMRDRIARLPEFDLAAFDSLEDYTLALGGAHSAWLVATRPRAALPALGAAAVTVRDTLVADATALARRGVISMDLVASFRSGVGYRAVVRDLMGLTTLLRDRWDVVSTLSAIDASELDAASNLADEIVKALGEREQNPANVAEAALVRQQAFTLWYRAYDEARRAVAYLRWREEDADKIAPSLYAGRGAGSHGKPDDKADDQAGVVPAAEPHAAEAAAAARADGPAPAYTAPGTPNSNPFAS